MFYEIVSHRKRYEKKGIELPRKIHGIYICVSEKNEKTKAKYTTQKKTYKNHSPTMKESIINYYCKSKGKDRERVNVCCTGTVCCNIRKKSTFEISLWCLSFCGEKRKKRTKNREKALKMNEKEINR